MVPPPPAGPAWSSRTFYGPTIRRSRWCARSGSRPTRVTPLVANGRLIGTLSFGTRTRPRFEAHELELLWTVSDQVAAAVDRGQLIARLEEQVRERRQAETERDLLLSREREARADAERASREKDEFLARLSHELRTPLSAMLGWIRMLRTGRLSPEKAERALESIERNARVQVQLIEDQVVNNLLSNAVKFSPPGGRVEVSLEQHGSMARIVVADTGHGIDADLLPHVFDRFRQGHRTTVHGHGGLGLGLTIVRELVELHGGIVHADSAGKNQGATFTVELPVMSLPSQAAYAAGAWAGRHPDVEPDTRLLEGLRILVVDDRSRS